MDRYFKLKAKPAVIYYDKADRFDIGIDRHFA